MRIQGANGKDAQVYYDVDLEAGPIGIGGMGQVFKAKRISEITGKGTDVAIKFLFDNLPLSAIERAKREASIRIQHENLIEMIDFIQIEEHAQNGDVIVRNHVVSELLRGVMLFDLLHNNIKETPDGTQVEFAEQLLNLYKTDRLSFSLKVIKNILSGIMALHDKGYIHRDIDPSNIMVTVDEKIKIIDFGIAREINQLEKSDRQLTSFGQFVGKAEYAAPELVLGDVNNQNVTTDLYAIGILLFEFITGQLPFTGSINDVIKQQQTADIPLKFIENKKLRKIIAKATAKKQSERFQSAAEFRTAIEQFENGKDDEDRSQVYSIVKQSGIWLGIASVGLAIGVLLNYLI